MVLDTVALATPGRAAYSDEPDPANDIPRTRLVDNQDRDILLPLPVASVARSQTIIVTPTVDTSAQDAAELVAARIGVEPGV